MDYFTFVKVVKEFCLKHLGVCLGKCVKRDKMALLYQILTDVTLCDSGCEFQLYLRNKK